jgi:hypothetical protein
MTLTEFKQSLSQDIPPASLSIYLKALWYDAKGDWQTAHAQVDHMNDETASWVHAYLHRKEGDQWNADYWYRRAGKKRPAFNLEEEWLLIVTAIL